MTATPRIMAIATLAVTVRAASVSFVQSSSPSGFINLTTIHETGSTVTTRTAPGLTNGYRFAYWTLNGLVQTNAPGQAANPLRFTLLEPATAVACFVPKDEDGNANRVPDWFEQRYAGLTNALQDADGDGLSLLDEYRRDWHPRAVDRVADGGLSLALSSPELAILNSALASFRLYTTPHGFADASIVTNIGAELCVEPAPRVIGGYRFVGWFMNGAPVTDRVGRAASGFTLPLGGNTVVQGRFVAEKDDTNANDVPDWFELEFLRTLSADTSSDEDGDGATLRTEYRRDWHPLMEDRIHDGGVAFACACPALVIVDTNLVLYACGSSPAGLVPSIRTVTNRHAVVSVPDRFGVANHHRFAFWTANGAVVTDVTGRACAGFALNLNANIELRAVFRLTEADEDSDGIPDWFEGQFGGWQGLNPLADIDADGLTAAEEYRRDCHPLSADRFADGGFLTAMSPPATIVLDPALVPFSISSSPFNLGSASHTVRARGSTVTLAATYDATNRYRFAYWLLNGNVVTDLTGRAAAVSNVTLTEPTTALAVFRPQDADSDADGLPDWFEAQYGGPAGLAPTSDGDGDGAEAIDEFRRDFHPALADTLVDGGLSLAVSAAATVRFGFFQRIESVLVSGVLSTFFSGDVSTPGGFAVGANAHPALGDWDADGDLDLFVGGSNGTMRIFENKGSPVVLNWEERTPEFAALAGVWTALVNPAPALGDWTGDGCADLAVGGGTGGVWLIESAGAFEGPALTGTPHTVFVPYALPPGTSGGLAVIPAFGDVSGDDWPDLLLMGGAGLVQCYTNTHSRTLPYTQPPQTNDLLGVPVPNATGLCAADVNEDGVIDVLVSDATGRIWEFLGTGPSR